MNKILVANRGEIALRVMKTAQRMGVNTVAVYSEADRDAPHVRFADESYYLGKSPSSESYLDADKLIEACVNLNVDAVHPGYGFLSENAQFAKLVEDRGITFIGPPPEAIKIMGSKLAAKNAVSNYDIPMVPGTDKAIKDVEKAKEIANTIGYPILIKASAGGGGKGMRIVNSENELEPQMQRAISEAQSSFGDGSVFIEKYVSSPKHIEIQILADKHGHIIHLNERECSVQRRHQKVIEEAPSVKVSSKLRKDMGEAAINVARSCGYVGAGTVEFLLDENDNFYFLEMNTRLQVEHPVTELITNLDLVELQIKIARGEHLAICQQEIVINGHAIELRIYAEDPSNNFLPSIGKLEHYVVPKGENIRVDNGYEQGMQIPIFYDPMISKLICHGHNRDEAINLMIKAIRSYEIIGVETTLGFGEFVMNHEAFRSGDYDTHFVQDYFNSDILKESRESIDYIIAQAALKLFLQDKQTLRPSHHEKS